MLLRELISQTSPLKTWGDLDTPLSSLIDDSRKTAEGACYIAVKGMQSDGHAFIPAALDAGVAAVIAQTPPTREALEKNTPWIQLQDTRSALSCLAARWYNFPGREMKILAVTGTNGKTTTSYLLHSIFEQVFHRAGLLGTIIFHDGLESYTATHTTPGALELQSLLSQMTLNDCRAVAMETSSHALSQHRVDCVPLDAGIFTNLTQDHLDYHGNMESYLEAKKILFDLLIKTAKDPSLNKKPCAIINIDDKAGEQIAAQFEGKLPVRTYGFSAKAEFKAVIRHISGKGSEFELQYKGRSYMVKIPLVGRFNIYNALGALAGAVTAGVSPRNAIKALALVPQVPGRLELAGAKKNIQGFVDYAHTPDALLNACRTLKELCKGRLITVFGCGGDRDRRKRPLMGEAAAEFSDLCIVTSDNPRSEDPAAIIRDIIPGLPAKNYKVISNRQEAIRVAVELAAPGDFILVAGKGHEDYQEIAGEKIPFNDKVILRMCLENWGV